MFYLRRGGVPETVSSGLIGLTSKPAFGFGLNTQVKQCSTFAQPPPPIGERHTRPTTLTSPKNSASES
jgi:hypothetical protein